MSSPANIGFTANGPPKLLDFGLARILAEEPRPGRPSRWRAMSGTLGAGLGELTADETAALTATLSAATAAGDLVVTPRYLSPEAVIGREPDPTFDLGGLAVVLHEALAGENPFAAQAVPEVLLRIVTAPVPPVSRLPPDCPGPLAQLVDGALSRQRRRRPQSASELAERLESVARELEREAAA